MAPDFFYLAASPNGRVPWADKRATAPGQRLTAVTAPEPFNSRQLTIAREPHDVLGAAHAKWPCKLWKVQADSPSRRSWLRRGDNTLAHAPAVTLVEEMPAHLALGPNASELLALFRTLENLLPSDIKLAESVEDEWWEANGGDDAGIDPDDSPSYLRLTRVGDHIKKSGLDTTRWEAAHHAKELAHDAVAPMFDMGLKQDRQKAKLRPNDPWEELERQLGSAASLAATALVDPTVDPAEADLLCEDLRRFTGYDAFANIRGHAGV